MIKTLHLTNAWHDQSGGIRTFYRALIAAAAVHRRHLRLVVPAASSRVEDVHEFARIYHVAAPASPWIDRRYRLLLPHRLLFGAGEIWRILRDERPDLVEVCDKYSLIYLGGLIRAGLLGRTPRPAVAALTCERMDDNVATFLSPSAAARGFSRWYMRTVYGRQCDAHIAVSRYTAAELSDVPRPVHRAPMGIDPRVFLRASRTRDDRRALYGAAAQDPDSVILLYAGRLSGEKNLTLLTGMMEALGESERPRFRLTVIGDGPLGEWLRAAMARVAPGRVHFAGHVADRETLARYLANADVFVHANPREPFGIGPLEAMAAGLPLVAPPSGGVLEYASHDNAWLAEATPARFAAAVRQVVADPQDYRRRVSRARETAASFDWSTVAARFFDLYDTICAESEPCRWIASRHLAISSSGH